MAKYAGRAAKLRVNGATFSLKRYSVTDADSGAEVMNSEFGGFTGKIPTADNIEVMVSQATLDSSENPFVAPLGLQTNQYVAATLYCAGLSGGIDWDLPIARVASTTMTGEVGPGGLQSVDVKLENYGPFTRPGGNL